MFAAPSLELLSAQALPVNSVKTNLVPPVCTPVCLAQLDKPPQERTCVNRTMPVRLSACRR